MYVSDLFYQQPKGVCFRLCSNNNNPDNNNGGGYNSYDGLNAAYSSSSRIISSPPGKELINFNNYNIGCLQSRFIPWVNICYLQNFLYVFFR